MLKNAVLLDRNQFRLFILSEDKSGFRAWYYIEIMFYSHLSSPDYIYLIYLNSKWKIIVFSLKTELFYFMGKDYRHSFTNKSNSKFNLEDTEFILSILM